MHRSEIAPKIRGGLKERQITIAGIARELEPSVSPQMVHNIINGQRSSRVEARLCELLGFNPWERWMDNSTAQGAA